MPIWSVRFTFRGYCFPSQPIIAPLVDFALSLILLFGMLVYAGIPLTWKLVTLPIFILIAMISAMGVSLVVSATNVKYRDVGHAIPFVMQIWMFVSPIVYPVSLVPEQWRFIYGLNPMAGVIEGFRWALLGQTAPDPMVMAASFLVFVVFLIVESGVFQADGTSICGCDLSRTFDSLNERVIQVLRQYSLNRSGK